MKPVFLILLLLVLCLTHVNGVLHRLVYWDLKKMKQGIESTEQEISDLVSNSIDQDENWLNSRRNQLTEKLRKQKEEFADWFETCLLIAGKSSVTSARSTNGPSLRSKKWPSI